MMLESLQKNNHSMEHAGMVVMVMGGQLLDPKILGSIPGTTQIFVKFF